MKLITTISLFRNLGSIVKRGLSLPKQLMYLGK